MDPEIFFENFKLNRSLKDIFFIYHLVDEVIDLKLGISGIAKKVSFFYKYSIKIFHKNTKLINNIIIVIVK